MVVWVYLQSKSENKYYYIYTECILSTIEQIVDGNNKQENYLKRNN